MDEHKENIHGNDVNVKMTDTQDDEKVSVREHKIKLLFYVNIFWKRPHILIPIQFGHRLLGPLV